MKILSIGDLHGQKPRIHFKDFDAIIAPGDFCSDAPRKYMFQILRKYLEDPNFEGDWIDISGKKKAKEMVKKSLKDGRKILEYLNSFGKPVFVVPGNWDWTGGKDEDWKFLQENFYKTYLIKGLENIRDVYHKKRSFGEIDIIGYGITSGPEYPQDKKILKRFTKAELKEKKIKYNKLENKVARLFKKTNKPVLYLSHNVPFNTTLDKITDKSSPRYGEHMGSFLSRQIVNKYQPLLCIGGHMHEHFGKIKMGETITINAGFGGHVNTLLTLKDGKIKKIEFWDGKNKYKKKE